MEKKSFMTSNAAIKAVDVQAVGVDWGTTHRRAYALDAEGHCVNELADDQGALACQGHHAESLWQLLNHLQARPRQVLLSGMAGSAMGWQLVPYVDASVALTDLGAHLFAIADTPVRIVPGYCVRNASGQPDTMRGEETQLLGAVCLGQHSGWFVLPGTHSKWVELRAGRVQQLRTYMTGELFHLLSRHGTLAATAGIAGAAAIAGSAWDAKAFVQGVQAADTASALSHQLYACRARVVSGDMAAASMCAYLSGLLIGTELQDVLRHVQADWRTQTITLIGSPALALHYQRAATLLGVQLQLLDARAAYLCALQHLLQARSNA